MGTKKIQVGDKVRILCGFRDFRFFKENTTGIVKSVSNEYLGVIVELGKDDEHNFHMKDLELIEEIQSVPMGTTEKVMKDLKKEIKDRFWKRVKSYLSEDLMQHNDWKIVTDKDVEWLIEEIRLDERKKTLEEVRVKVGNKSAKVIGKLNNRQYDYGLGVVRCVGILSEVISKITKRGK